MLRSGPLRHLRSIDTPDFLQHLSERTCQAHTFLLKVEGACERRVIVRHLDEGKRVEPHRTPSSPMMVSPFVRAQLLLANQWLWVIVYPLSQQEF